MLSVTVFSENTLETPIQCFQRKSGFQEVNGFRNPEILMAEVGFMRLHREQGPYWELVRAMSHSSEGQAAFYVLET